MCEVGCKYTSFMNSGSAIGITYLTQKLAKPISCTHALKLIKHPQIAERCADICKGASLGGGERLDIDLC